MKCPHCGQEHPGNFKYCPNTAKALGNQLKACTNKKCQDFGKYILPSDSKFCPSCGEPIECEDCEEDTSFCVDLDLIHVLRKKLKKRILEILS